MDVYSHIPSCFRFWPVPNSPVRLTSPGLTDRFLCLAAESALVKEHGLVQKCGIPKLYLEEKNILILSNGIYPKFRLIGIMFLTSRPCGAELPFMISHHQSYQRWKTVFLPPSPHQVGSGKKCAKLQRLVVQSGPESVYNMFKMLQVCHSYQPPGNGSICVAPLLASQSLCPWGFPQRCTMKAPNRTNHCWLKVSTRGCRQFRDTIQCSQGTQGHRHKNGIWRADLLDQWPYLDEQEFRKMNAVLSCP